MKRFLLACGLVGSLALGTAPAFAGSSSNFSDSALLAAGCISRTQAISIAMKTVPNAKVISASFEDSDNIAHWSVDLVGAVYEYEVWISCSGKVLRVITQPK